MKNLTYYLNDINDNFIEFYKDIDNNIVLDSIITKIDYTLYYFKYKDTDIKYKILNDTKFITIINDNINITLSDYDIEYIELFNYIENILLNTIGDL